MRWKTGLKSLISNEIERHNLKGLEDWVKNFSSSIKVLLQAELTLKWVILSGTERKKRQVRSFMLYDRSSPDLLNCVLFENYTNKKVTNGTSHFCFFWSWPTEKGKTDFLKVLWGKYNSIMISVNSKFHLRVNFYSPFINLWNTGL